MTNEAAAPVDATTATGARSKASVFEWFWRGQALRQARAFRAQLPEDERRALSRALVAAELAERALEPVDAFRHGPAIVEATSLYREAAYWALRAQSSQYTGRTLASVFEQVPVERLELAAGDAEALATVRRALVERDFVDTAALPPELLPKDAQAARRFVRALLERKLAPEARVGRLLFQRSWRCLGLLALISALVFGASWHFSPLRRAPDLAAGRPWRASSSPDKCNPKHHRCAGVHTDMFFTTSEEVEPWVELDLGPGASFNAIVVTNRSDCCPDRAVPLIAEVSRDQSQWREVARRDDTFSVWEARFAPQTARYLRLRVPRRTTFHLDKIEVKNVR